MTNKEIFYKTLDIAILKGYIVPKYILSLSKILNCDLFDLKDMILYSKDFAKIYFGKKDKIYNKDVWVNRLKEMSQTENEFKYLEKFLNV